MLVRTIHHHRRLTTSETALASALRYIQVRARPASMGEWADVGGNTGQEETLPGVQLTSTIACLACSCSTHPLAAHLPHHQSTNLPPSTQACLQACTTSHLIVRVACPPTRTTSLLYGTVQ